ncbi:uncharacterized protein LOC119488527 [Sebastes umbrosus]|uniref:uncharacterized protein LOC119488527 n=1 Tax=Sebastes umbrosus TaxID=72105 RepID=UPI00189D31DE|nr:uncharacterized protein LOC119488527 [Sebastes umbrosus]
MLFFITGKMQKTVFFPGRMSVTFRKGPLGYLRQDPTDAAKLLKDNPSLQDKSAPVKEELVRKNALSVIILRGGNASDKTEVAGEYILQFGKYKGKSFRWLLENDIGYTIYLIKNQQKEETAGVFMAGGHSKDSLLSFVSYALSFQEIQSLLNYEKQKPVVTAAAAASASEDDQLVGFGSRAKSTWREIWDSRDDGYAAFIMRKSCAPGTKMHKLQVYLQKKLPSPSGSSLVTHASQAPAEAMVMDEDEELERAMLGICPSKQHVQSCDCFCTISINCQTTGFGNRKRFLTKQKRPVVDRDSGTMNSYPKPKHDINRSFSC